MHRFWSRINASRATAVTRPIDWLLNSDCLLRQQMFCIACACNHLPGGVLDGVNPREMGGCHRASSSPGIGAPLTHDIRLSSGSPTRGWSETLSGDWSNTCSILGVQWIIICRPYLVTFTRSSQCILILIILTQPIHTHLGNCLTCLKILIYLTVSSPLCIPTGLVSITYQHTLSITWSPAVCGDQLSLGQGSCVPYNKRTDNV